MPVMPAFSFFDLTIMANYRLPIVVQKVQHGDIIS
jgi:hypothetical protein